MRKYNFQKKNGTIWQNLLQLNLNYVVSRRFRSVITCNQASQFVCADPALPSELHTEHSFGLAICMWCSVWLQVSKTQPTIAPLYCRMTLPPPVSQEMCFQRHCFASDGSLQEGSCKTEALTSRSSSGAVCCFTAGT